MRNLHENFRKNHHLKHWGRLQYGLFLKVMHCRTRHADRLMHWEWCLAVTKGRDAPCSALWRVASRPVASGEGGMPANQVSATHAQSMRISLANSPCSMSHDDQWNQENWWRVAWLTNQENAFAEHRDLIGRRAHVVAQ
jgi:hypothetical protein